MNRIKACLALAFCVQFISAADADVVCAKAQTSAVNFAAFKGASDLIETQGQMWIGDACAAIDSAQVGLINNNKTFSVGFADDGDCSGNVFLDAKTYEVTGYGLVGCY